MIASMSTDLHEIGAIAARQQLPQARRTPMTHDCPSPARQHGRHLPHMCCNQGPDEVHSTVKRPKPLLLQPAIHHVCRDAGVQQLGSSDDAVLSRREAHDRLLDCRTIGTREAAPASAIRSITPAAGVRLVNRIATLVHADNSAIVSCFGAFADFTAFSAAESAMGAATTRVVRTRPRYARPFPHPPISDPLVCSCRHSRRHSNHGELAPARTPNSGLSTAALAAARARRPRCHASTLPSLPCDLGLAAMRPRLAVRPRRQECSRNHDDPAPSSRTTAVLER